MSPNSNSNHVRISEKGLEVLNNSVLGNCIISKLIANKDQLSKGAVVEIDASHNIQFVTTIKESTTHK